MNQRRHLTLSAAALLVAEVWTSSPRVEAAPAEYQLTVRNDWTQVNHKPGVTPFNLVAQPHFSHLGGGTHNSDH